MNLLFLSKVSPYLSILQSIIFKYFLTITQKGQFLRYKSVVKRSPSNLFSGVSKTKWRSALRAPFSGIKIKWSDFRLAEPDLTSTSPSNRISRFLSLMFADDAVIWLIRDFPSYRFKHTGSIMIEEMRFTEKDGKASPVKSSLKLMLES